MNQGEQQRHVICEKREALTASKKVFSSMAVEAAVRASAFCLSQTMFWYLLKILGFMGGGGAHRRA